MSRTEQFWDKLSKNYDKPNQIAEVEKYESIEYIKECLKESDIVLDFGCATGTISSSLAGSVKEMHGIDVSSKMIQIAEQRAGERKINNIFFSQSSIFDKKYSGNTFNMIITFSVLHVLEDTESTIQRMHNLLKPGGLFVSLTPCLGEKPFLHLLLKLIQKLRILPDIRGFKTNELETLIANRKFQIIESASLDNNPLEHFIVARKL